MGDHTVETVKVKSSIAGHEGYKIINKTDFDPKEHTLYKEKAKDSDEPDAEVEATDRNPSGTFSEPTPTDIRYPDKDDTEFENNHITGQSAAEMREERGLADAPGGLHPDPDFKPGGADVTEAAEKNAPAANPKPAKK